MILIILFNILHFNVVQNVMHYYIYMAYGSRLINNFKVKVKLEKNIWNLMFLFCDGRLWHY